MHRFLKRLFSWAAAPTALLAAACGGASSSAPAPAPAAAPVESAPVVVVPAPTATEEKPRAPEPTPAPPLQAKPPSSMALILLDGPPGTWTGEHGNYDSPVREVWGAGDLVFAATVNEFLQSNDRGLTWRPVNLPPKTTPMSVWGTSPDEVWVGARDLILRSTDRGTTWKPTAVPANAYYNGFWADDRDVYAVGSDGVILHSSDRGDTWERQGEALGLRWLHGVWGKGRDVWAFGEGAPKDGSWMSTTALVHTKDRGKTWTTVALQAAPLRGICGTGDGVMHVIDASGSIHQSKDRGKTWTKAHSFGSMELCALACRGKSEIFVGGRNRTFQHSEDGGKTWTDELAAQNKWTQPAFSMVDTIFALPSGEVFVGGEGVYVPRPTGTLFRRR
ncbi:sialidase family protein [Polyangium mundeleinium]|uniref:YCF48-related protein n=1 Tax=Polyangium mundeleinium TaxID=2995306 RepID=A0ABT5ERN4_9BACT|nr:YCF48-related protein [Polyangium mundeleinium]MDC0744481.1 YCF48-related protein [Polyangium mundeleinium]